MARFLKNMGINTGWAGGQANGNIPATSEISSRYIHMTLYHDTGRMDGRVLEGQFRDAELSTLNLAQLKQLFDEIQQDADSVNLLMAYLDREHPDWQDGAETRARQDAFDDNMTEAQALAILGLESAASYEDVIQAHRRLMQKMHPDRGGSTFLAAKINAAKELLVKLRPERSND